MSLKKIIFILAAMFMMSNFAYAQNGNGRGRGNQNQNNGFDCNGNFFTGQVNVTVTNLNFGSYNPALSVPLDSTFGVTLSCANGFFSNFATLPPMSISLSSGRSGNYSSRTMTGASKLRYQIYTDSTFTTVWGNGTGATQTISAGSNGLNSQTIYGDGEIAPLQFVSPGAYSDTITVTVSY